MSIKDLKNTTVMSVQKFHTKYWIEGTYLTAVHEEKDSIVINVAKILLEDAI